MSARARRLAKYLEEKLGWEVYDNRRQCEVCGQLTFDRAVPLWCKWCGSKLPGAVYKKETYVELEEALRYALNEKGRKKGGGK